MKQPVLVLLAGPQTMNSTWKPGSRKSPPPPRPPPGFTGSPCMGNHTPLPALALHCESQTNNITSTMTTCSKSIPCNARVEHPTCSLGCVLLTASKSTCLCTLASSKTNNTYTISWFQALAGENFTLGFAFMQCFRLVGYHR